MFCVGVIHLIIINFIGGIVFPIFSVGYALFTEFFHKNKNGFLIGIYNAIYPIAGILFCFFFMFSSSWRTLYFITSLIHCYYTYLVFKYFCKFSASIKLSKFPIVINESVQAVNFLPIYGVPMTFLSVLGSPADLEINTL